MPPVHKYEYSLYEFLVFICLRDPSPHFAHYGRLLLTYIIIILYAKLLAFILNTSEHTEGMHIYNFSMFFALVKCRFY